jgi:hypothetical protein
VSSDSASLFSAVGASRSKGAGPSARHSTRRPALVPGPWRTQQPWAQRFPFVDDHAQKMNMTTNCLHLERVLAWYHAVAWYITPQFLATSLAAATALCALFFAKHGGEVKDDLQAGILVWFELDV